MRNEVIVAVRVLLVFGGGAAYRAPLLGELLEPASCLRDEGESLEVGLVLIPEQREARPQLATVVAARARAPQRAEGGAQLLLNRRGGLLRPLELGSCELRPHRPLLDASLVGLRCRSTMPVSPSG
jgi:hypothetical protein